ncbi:MAG: DUF262 domain-containing protein [Deltaproteobacteria bacterium]|nr:DUF262 domain-containing protein [Deltaproteobacteria bacterium]
MKKTIKTTDTKITDFVSNLYKGLILIPSFQREFVWEQDDIIHLWESIYRFIPVGSILCWETGTRLNIHRRPGGATHHDEACKAKRYLYILDGQQRATSLLMAVHRENIMAKGRGSFDHRLFYDGYNMKFFFAAEYLRRKRELGKDFLVSMHDLFNTGSGLIDSLTKRDDCTGHIKKGLVQLKYVFNNYQLPVTTLHGYSTGDVSEIFERINQQGKRLKSIDIMIARTFQNYAYPVEEDL